MFAQGETPFFVWIVCCTVEYVDEPELLAREEATEVWRDLRCRPACCLALSSEAPNMMTAIFVRYIYDVVRWLSVGGKIVGRFCRSRWSQNGVTRDVRAEQEGNVFKP